MISHQDTPKTAYLRHRPFLVVDYYTVPFETTKVGRTVRTERKDWMTEKGSTSIMANPYVVSRIKDAHLKQAAIIIDLQRDVVIKNRLSDTDAEVLQHCKEKYYNIIAPALRA